MNRPKVSLSREVCRSFNVYKLNLHTCRVPGRLWWHKPLPRAKQHTQASESPRGDAKASAVDSTEQSVSSQDLLDTLWEESIRDSCSNVVAAHTLKPRSATKGGSSGSALSSPKLEGKPAAQDGRWRALDPDSQRPGPPEGISPGIPPPNTALMESLGSNAAGPLAELQERIEDVTGWLLYEYYNWRQDTLNDLLVITAVNLGIILGGAYIQNHFIMGNPDAWTDLYDVATIILGQNFPGEDSQVAQQVLALFLGLAGLAGFALALALAEQLVLDVLQSNVQKGSAVHEAGHVLVLGWCKSQRDLEVVWRIVEQMCYAFRVDGGTTIVVMSERGKLEMEAFFRRVLPQEQRHGSRLVFRQGSPMVLGDLHMVRAADARSVVVVSDQSLSPDDADAQSLHTAVLLDEMMTPGSYYRRKYKARPVKVSETDGWYGHNIVTVELLTLNALPLVRFATSARVVPVPAVRFNAMRMARVLHSPVTILVTNQIHSYLSRSQVHIHEFPALVGRTLSEVRFMFPDGIVMAVQNSSLGKLMPAPPPGYRIQPGEELVIVRPGTIRHADYQPLPAPVAASIGSWTPNPDRSLVITLPEGLRITTCTQRGGIKVDDSGQDVKMLVQATEDDSIRCSVDFPDPDGSQSLRIPMTKAQVSRPQKVLVCGWGEEWFMLQLLRELDKTLAGFPPGSEITCINQHSAEYTVGHITSLLKMRHASLLHRQADPIRQKQMKAAGVDMRGVTAVIIVSEQAWSSGQAPERMSSEPHSQAHYGPGPVANEDVGLLLRLDSLALMVHLNIRQLMSEQGVRDVNIITEKVASEVYTRFEDMQRLPLGATVNLNSFSSIALSQVMVDPRKMLPFTFVPHNSHTLLIDAEHYTQLDERVSFYTLMKRAEALGHTLLGYIILPTTQVEEMQLVLNPEGHQARSLQQVWHDGSQRLKFVSMAQRKVRKAAGAGLGLGLEAVQQVAEAVGSYALTTQMPLS